MGDVADILGLAKGGGGGAGGGGGRSRPAVKRPDGMSKEVFALLGNGTELPPLAPGANPNDNPAAYYKVLAAKPAVKWAWKAFPNSARRDGLKLHHWQRVSTEESDYAFARFNRRSATVQYTPEEYEALVAPTEAVSGWSREETDMLFRLCAEYDLRWYIVEDRWPLPKARSVVEMKARYYTIAKLIIQTRRSKKASKAVAAAAAYAVAQAAAAAADPTGAQGSDQGNGVGDNSVARGEVAPELDADALNAVLGKVEEPTATVSAKAIAQTENALLDYTYEEAYDIKRNKQLQVLFSRSLAEEKEEARLISEVRRIDVQLRRLQKDQPRVAAATKKKGKSKAPPVLHQFPPTLVDKLLNNPAAMEKEAKAKKPGVYLRSAEFLTPLSSSGIGPRLQAKMDDVLNELSVPLRPVPTVKVCQAYNKIRQDVLKLLALQSKLHEQNNLARKLQGIPGSGSASSSSRASGSTKAARANKRKSSASGGAPTVAQLAEGGSDAPARTSGRKRQPSQVMAEELAVSTGVKVEPGKRKAIGNAAGAGGSVGSGAGGGGAGGGGAGGARTKKAKTLAS